MWLLLRDALIRGEDLALRDVRLPSAHDLATHEDLPLRVGRVATLRATFLLLPFEDGLLIALLLVLQFLLSFEGPRGRLARILRGVQVALAIVGCVEGATRAVRAVGVADELLGSVDVARIRRLLRCSLAHMKTATAVALA